MRYIPQSKYTFDEIVEQCRNAINSIPTASTEYDEQFYDELLQFEQYHSLIAS